MTNKDECAIMAGDFDTVPPATTSHDDWQRVRDITFPMCEFESGIEVDSTFDEPYAAKRAREIFAICERNLKE